MAMKSAGRVSIRVLPDSTRFKQDLEKTLRRLERQMQVKIPVELELAREQLARLKRQIESLVIKIKPTIDLQLDQADIDAIKARIEAMRPTVNIDLDTNRAAARMANLSRSRRIDMRPVLNNAAVTSFLAKMKGLAGLNVIGDSFRGGIEFFQEIDRNAFKFAGLLAKMGAMTALITSGVGQLVVMGAQLASMANIAILAPAFLTGMGIGIASLVVVLKDMKTVLADLGPLFTGLQDRMSARFWEQAEAPIRSLVETLFPTLDKQLQETSKQLGGLFAEFAESMKREATPERVTRMFERMNRAIEIVKGAIGPMTSAFVTLGEHGSKYFERFSRWIVELSTRFDNFIQKANENGDLDRWTENAIQGFKDLGNTIRGVTRILAAINTAAVRAGTLNFGAFAEALNRTADAMNSERFQNTLVTLFEGANAAVAGIVDGLKKMGPAVESAAPSISRVLGTVGEIFSKIGGMLAEIIANPKLQAGIEHFATAVSTALDKLQPAVKPFADSLGGVFELMGKIIVAVSDLAADILIKLGPKFDKIGDKFGELIDPLNASLKKMVDELGPILDKFYDEVVVPLVDFLKKEGLPFIDKVVEKLGPSFQRGLEEVGRFIREDLTPLFRTLNDLLDKLDKHDLTNIFNLPDLADPKKVMPGFQGGWLMPGGPGQGGRFQQDWDNFWRPINEWWVNEAWPGVEKWLLAELKKFEDWSNNEFGPAVRSAVDNLIKGFWGWVNDLFFGNEEPPEWTGNIFTWLGERIKRSWEKTLEDIEKWWADVKKGFQKWFKSTFGFGASGEGFDPATITDGGGLGGGGASRGVGAKILPAAIDKEGEINWLDQLKIGMATKWAEMGGAIDTFKTNALVSWGIWASETASKAETAMGGADTTITQKAGNMGATIAGWVATNVPTWSAAFQTMLGVAQEKMGGSSETTATNMGTISGKIVSGIETIRQNWGPGWDTFKATLSTAWQVMTGDTRSGVDDTASEAGQLPTKAKNSMGPLDTLVSSGRSLVEGFAAGMRERLSWVQSAAIAVAAEVAKHMPHSPAKAGPLSGMGYTTHSGRALVKDFAGGMMDNMAKVRKATAAVANAASLGANLDSDLDLDRDGVVIDRSQVIIQSYNPVAEPTSRTIEKNANNIRMAKGF